MNQISDINERKKFIENIKYLQKKHKLTDNQFASLLNISTPTIQKWKQNNSLPSLPQLIKLSEIFNISINKLIGLEYLAKGNPNGYGKKGTTLSRWSQTELEILSSIPRNKIKYKDYITNLFPNRTYKAILRKYYTINKAN